MTDTVRKQKSGDQLAVGDWLAPGELSDLAAEVLFTISYPGAGGTHVQLVARQQGMKVPFSDVVAGTSLFDLASDEDLAELRQAAERASLIADIRAFADWLEANPWAPAPSLLRAAEQFGNPYNALGKDAGLAKVREVAERLGVKVEEQDDRTRMEVEVGRVEYSLLTWHKDGRPAEPVADEDDADGGFAFGQDDHLPLHRFVGGEPGAVACGLTLAGLPKGHGYVGAWDSVTCDACLTEKPAGAE